MIKIFLEDLKKKRKEIIPLNPKRSSNLITRNNLKILTSNNDTDEDDQSYKQIKTSFVSFPDLYNISLKNKRKLNDSMNTKTVYSVRRRIMFTDINYPVTLEDDELGKSLQKQIFFKKPPKAINIIEELDNEDIMMKYIPKNNYEIFHEHYKFKDKDNYEEIINFFIEHIENYHLSSIDNKSTFYKLKKYGIDKIDLNFKSLSVIISKDGNIIYEFTLPLNLIPFYYSLNSKDFILFITRIMKIIDNKIIFDKTLIEENVKHIIQNKVLFNKDSSFFDNKLLKLKYPLIFNNEEYEFKILLPHIELIKKDSLKIIKNAGKGLIYYLLNNDFDNWGNISLCYLSSFKSFRQIIRQIYKNENDNELKIYDIDDLIEFESIYGNINSEEDSEKNLYFLCEIQKNDSKTIIFFRLYFYKIEIICGGKEYKYELNYHDIKELFSLQKIYDLEDIIHKCMITDLNYKNLYFSLDLVKGYSTNDNFFYPEKDRISTIFIKKPRVHWNEFSKEFNLETYELNDDLIEYLINNPLNSFSSFFYKNQFDILNEIEIQKNKKKIQLRSMNSMKINEKESPKQLKKDKKTLTRKQTITNKTKKINIPD